MPTRLKLLLVEDSPDDALLVLRELQRGGFDVVHSRVETGAAMRAALKDESWDAVISDYSMPAFSAPSALAALRESGTDIPFIICSGTIGEETAVEALRAGAHDFMLKNKLARLVPALEREIKEAAVRRARRQADEEVKRLEAQVQQAQKMEAIGRLAGGVAHDFNNILTAILSTADLALEDASLTSQLRSDLETIRESGNRGAAITRQLLAFSRKQVVQLEALDLSSVVTNIAAMLRRLLTPGVTLEVDAKVTRAMEADRTQVEQVLLNLVSNANDAMPNGGVVLVSTSELVTHAPTQNNGRVLPAGSYVVLRVCDTGVGMDEVTAAQIFEPFFTTKDATKGTGLGLATVYGIVDQAHGHIFVHSRPGAGTTFEILFPGCDAELPSAIPVETHEEQAGGNEVLLVVEDEAAVRATMCRALRQRGYFVLEAKHGEDALTVMDGYHAPVHLVISDVVMPTMNGAELVELLRGWYPTLKVLFVSGYSDELLEKQGVLMEGLDVDYMPKPFTADELARRVRRLLDHGRRSWTGQFEVATSDLQS